MQGKRRAAYAAGGRNKATPQRLVKRTPTSLKPVLATLFAALAGLEDGSTEPKVASAMASVSTALVRIFEAAALEQRLDALERAHEQRQTG